MSYTYEDYKHELANGDHCNPGYCSVHNRNHPEEELDEIEEVIETEEL